MCGIFIFNTVLFVLAQNCKSQVIAVAVAFQKVISTVTYNVSS